MAGTAEAIWRKPSQMTRLRLLKSFFQIDDANVDPASFDRYFQYYEREMAMLVSGPLRSPSAPSQLPMKTHEDLIGILDTVRSTKTDKLSLISQLVNQCSREEKEAIRMVDLVLRLWLMVNVREPEALLHAPQTPILRWTHSQKLENFLLETFPPSRWKIEAKDSRLHPSFTAAFMVDICGLKLEWTDCLADHLRLDRRVNALRIYSYKSVLQAHMNLCNTAASGLAESPLPERLLLETIWSLNLLFPQWHPETNRLLMKHGQDFQQTGPYEGPPTLNLVEFQYWRDRLSELHDVVFLSPPVSWAQLWRDRRNPQQFWTFWLALMILCLTLVSTMTGIVQAWASIRALT